MTASYELASRKRRELLRSIVAGATIMGTMPSALSPAFARSGYVVPDNYADPDTASRFWAQPRVLRLVRQETGETVESCYWRDGRLEIAGYVQICRLLRDVKAGQAVTIDLRLLNLLRGMQGWLASTYGITEHYQINSGYRTESTNRNTEGAAKNSLHKKGQAVDGRFPSLPVQYTGELFRAFQSGGVGFYLNKHKFIHADVGRVRQWRG